MDLRKKYHLGIHVGPHDASVSLIDSEGNVEFSCNEERFTRIKYNAYPGLPTCAPYNAFFYALKNFKNIESVNFSNQRNLSFALKYLPKLKPQIFEHHKCHNSAAYYTSGFEDAIAFSCDATDEEFTTSTEIFYVNKGTWIPMERIDADFSIGAAYAFITGILFGNKLGVEGKTMGLAAFGDPHMAYDAVEKLFPLFNGFTGLRKVASAQQFNLLKGKFKGEHVAAACQKILEDKVIGLLKSLKTPCKNIVFSGGIFHNVTLNKKIRETGLFKKIWVYPDTGDSGVSLGAAFLGAQKGKKLNSMFIGPKFDLRDILVSCNIPFKQFHDDEIINIIAQSLCDNKIIGMYRGKMEAGPRALGHRSIIMSPLKQKNKDILNTQIKKRESFRPFGPSITKDSMHKYLMHGYHHKYMIESFDAYKNAFNKIPAVIHIDGTVRPQIVEPQDDLFFYNLLKKFGKLSGEECLINTSFNIAGEPIVCTPMDAIKTFTNSGLDILVLENYLFFKNGNSLK